MIDIRTEKLVKLSDVPALPCFPEGAIKSLSTVYRWTTCGVRGVTLEYIPVGGKRYTSLEAVARFSEQLATPDVKPVKPPPPSQIRRNYEDAMARLNAGGIKVAVAAAV